MRIANLVAEVVADRADDSHVGEAARRQREVHGGAAELALALAEGRPHRVERDRSHHRQGHRIGHGGIASALMRAVQIREFGGPEVLELVDLPDPVPAAGEVLVEVARAGMNFADTHKRHNAHDPEVRREQLPLIPGNEISGRVSEDGLAASPPSSPAAPGATPSWLPSPRRHSC